MARAAPTGIGTVRASEIGTFLFCERAWSYQRLGVTPADVALHEAGVAWHRRLGRRILAAGFLRTAGWILILGAIAGLAAYLALRMVG
jgi:hypothetical protein